MQAHEVHDISARLAVWQAYLRTHATIISLLERYLLREQELPLLWYDTLDRLSQFPHKSMRLQELAEAISFNLISYGKPRFVDFTVPEEPLYSFQPPASFEKVFNAEQRLLVASNKPRLPSQAGTLREANDRVGSSSALDLAEEKFADKESFIKVLGQQPVIQARFAQYLMQEPVTRKLKGAQFVVG